MSRFLRNAVFVLALATIPVGLSGCLWLAIPSLAYQGYKYEHNKNEKPQTSTTQNTTQKKSAQSNQTPPQNQIE